MRWTTFKPGPAGRALPFLVALLLGMIASTPSARAGEEVRRAIPPSILTDPVPVQTVGREGRPIELAGSEATVRVSTDRIPAGVAEATLSVRRLSGPPGARLSATLSPRDGGASVAGSETRRRKLLLTGLSADPGRYRLTVAVAGRTVGSTPVAVVPQGRTPVADRSPRARASAASAPSRQSINAAEPNADLYFDQGPQASSAVAIAGGDPGRTIAATADEAGPPVVIVSNLGLRAGSEVQRTVPGSSTGTPAVAADPTGDLWAAAASAGGGPILLSRISPGSDAFTNPLVELPDFGADLNQQPALAVDPGASIAAAWVRSAGTKQEVVVSVCDISAAAADCDSASAWSGPVAVSAAPAQYASPDLDFGPDGELSAVWWNASSTNAIEANRCAIGEDCAAAASWNELTKIEDLDSAGGAPLPLFCPIIAAPGGLVGPSPQIAVSSEGMIHISYSDLRNNADPSNPTRCTGAGTDATFDSYVASGVAPELFPAPNSGVRISFDGAGDLNDNFLPAISVDEENETIEASFYSTQDNVSGQFTHRYLATSTDDGLTFRSQGRLTSDRSRFSGSQSNGFDYGDRQAMDSVGGVSRAVWTDARALQNNDGDLYGLVPPSDSTITSSPAEVTPNPTESVSFTSEATRVECSLDGLAFVACTSPVTYGPLPNGPHTVRVLATDQLGNPVDPTPAVANWRTEDLDPPETTLVEGPPEVTFDKRVSYDLAADEEGAIFECSFDGEPFQRCRPPKSPKVELGRHVFSFRAVDIGGNADPTPASASFLRKRACKQIGPKLKRKLACALERCAEIQPNRKTKRKRCVAKAEKRNAKAKLKKELRECRGIGSDRKRAECIAKAERRFERRLAKIEKRKKGKG